MDQIDPQTAQAALADIRHQREFVVERLDTMRPLRMSAAGAMGVAVASLALPGTIVAGVATFVFTASLLPLLATPTSAGVVPRDGRRALSQLYLACMALFGTLTLGLVGHQQHQAWVSLLGGVAATVVAILTVQWRRGSLRRQVLAETTHR